MAGSEPAPVERPRLTRPVAPAVVVRWRSSPGSASWSGVPSRTSSTPDWSGFWPAVRIRIASEKPPPVRESWWLPVWKPVWGHPRVALGSLMVSGLAAGLVLWPSPPVTLAAPVVVQDVSSADPDRSVMVYSSPDDDVTVIWVFNPGEQDEQS